MYNLLKQNKVKLVYLPLVFYWIIMLILTSIPTGTFPPIEAIEDKIKHFGAYTLLTILLSLTLHFQQKLKRVSVSYFFYTVLIILTYSTLDELHQIPIPGRTADIYDWLANLLGLIVGLFIIKKFIIKNHSKEINYENGTK